MNDGEARFQNREEAGFVPASVMGAQLIDYNLDGWMDVSSVRAAILEICNHSWSIGITQTSITNVALTNAAELFGKIHGIATADVDHDGDQTLW